VGVTYSFDELQVLQRSTRPNLAPGRATLLAAWREGISGGLPEMAVDKRRWTTLTRCPHAHTANCGLINSGERTAKESN
jgi:hypothetical protein